jgi:two-component system, OmpR family, KDP operon response regulator KdpE
MRNQGARDSGTSRRPPLARRLTPDGDGPSDAIVHSKELHFDFDRRVIIVRGETVHLAPKEFDLLRYLVANRGRPVSHQQVLRAVWGPAFGDQRERLRVVVNELRKKIEAHPARPKYIVTEFCVGYRFVLPEDARIQRAHSVWR